MQNDIDQRKKILRRSVLAKRGSLTDQARRIASEAATKHLLETPEVGAASSVLMFCSFGHEISTDGLIDRLLQRGTQVLVPWVDHGSLAATRISSMQELEPGFRGIREPVNRVAVEPNADVILVPGVAFDAEGHRLGYGGAFYDDFLPTTRGFRIGLCFDCQIAEAIPVDAHDERVDLVVTESGTLRPRIARAR
ncbi:MAG: 5-formyltetrahydrofolate cyclo-ligase [Actinomycetota bacterium]